MIRIEKLAPPERFLLAVGLLVTALSLIAINGGWFSDDRFYVENNFFLKGLPFYDLWRLFIPTSAHNLWDWQPVRDVYLKAGLMLFGEIPAPLKLMNIGLYLGLTALTYRASLALMNLFRIADAQRTAAIATAIYILHPVHIESIQWISGSKDLLMAVFCFAAVPPWIRWLAHGKKEDAIRTALFTALAVLSKGLGISFLGVLWLIALAAAAPGNRFKYATVKLAPVMLPALACFIAFFLVSPIGYASVWEIHDWTERPFIVLGGQLLLALAPYPLAVAYAPYGPLQTLYSALGVGGLVLILWSIWRYAKTPDRPMAFGALFFAVMVLPHLQLIPYVTNSMIADRFDFLPVYGVAFALAVGSQRISFGKARLGVGLLLLVLAALFALRSIEWRTPEAMSRNDFAKTGSPLGDPAWQKIIQSVESINFSLLKAKRNGEKMTDNQLKTILNGLGHVQIGLNNPPPTVNKDTAAYNLFVGQQRNIARAYEMIYEMHGDDALLGFDAALFFLKQKEYHKAAAWAGMAIETPGLPPESLSTAYKYAGIAHSESGRRDLGIQYLSLAVDTMPRDPAAACYLKAYAPNDPRGQALCP